MVFAGCWVQLRGGEARRVCFLMPSSVCLSWAAKDGKEKEPIRPVDSKRKRERDWIVQSVTASGSEIQRQNSC
ncbi:hypothetical protein ASPBRDRAFT_570318 [Aspergillus brasiliensis CBS 101740]|uniref:Uncharacterized protein n=1 Tax=Aspergillus brasiliensis (strain CBS 101740 / IMI 381727 / IBT 21946) TaxID=767769 RepID=A0A1L9UIW0_ASPBC|nr:hypothetical protein ASPBRDRAFT_570318 [Aspergillus brasiliensis CBS 101740]